MQRLSDLLEERESTKEKETTVTTGRNKLNPTVTTVTTVEGKRGSKFFDADQLFEQLHDLVNQQFRSWYCKQFYRLGRERVIILAAQARQDGFDKRKLFSYLLKAS